MEKLNDNMMDDIKILLELNIDRNIDDDFYLGTQFIKRCDLIIDYCAWLDDGIVGLEIRPRKRDLSVEMLNEVICHMLMYYYEHRELLKVDSNELVIQAVEGEIRAYIHTDNAVSVLLGLSSIFNNACCTIYQKLQKCRCKRCHIYLLNEPMTSLTLKGLETDEAIDDFFKKHWEASIKYKK
ncbi:hypothetical protein E9840_11225 [Tissierella creatinini]|nr:hypothetical protein E9840_11225 [Tissierella creatinini]TJX62906.1 hypothetical protein E8P77_16280 [Soehngenia saccharolytica]